MSFNIPEDIRDQSAPWNSRDEIEHPDKCPLCGGIVVLMGDGGFGAYYQCCTCNLRSVNGQTDNETLERWEDHNYETSLDCPNCDKPNSFKIVKAVYPNKGYRVSCKCGISGPYGKDEQAALENWHKIF